MNVVAISVGNTKVVKPLKSFVPTITFFTKKAFGLLVHPLKKLKTK